MTNISIIVAIAKLNAIGQNNDLLAYIPNDLKRFKALTTGHAVIMGRKTFESLPNGALPNRRNIVISRNLELKLDKAEVVSSTDLALKLCKDEDEVFVIGGATVYEAFLPKANNLYLTLINQYFHDADTFFPEVNPDEWNEISRMDIDDDEITDFNYVYLDLMRKL